MRNKLSHRGETLSNLVRFLRDEIMSGIDKGFLFGILTEVLRGNKRPTFSLSR